MSYIWTGNAFINLANIGYAYPHPDAPEERTHLLGNGFQVVIGVPFTEFKALVEKLIKDQYEYSIKMNEYNHARRSQDLKDIAEKFTRPTM